jgi:hypothetical protein
MLGKVIDFLLELVPCRHQRETWPIHNRRICLDCGRERAYFLLASFPRDPLVPKTRQAC